jgi:hypothetical protein
MRYFWQKMGLAIFWAILSRANLFPLLPSLGKFLCMYLASLNQRIHKCLLSYIHRYIGNVNPTNMSRINCKNIFKIPIWSSQLAFYPRFHSGFGR